MSEVEIIWPAKLDQNRLQGVADILGKHGVATTCRVSPVRRGPESTVLILIATTSISTFLKSFLIAAGSDAYRAMSELVGELFGRGGGEDPDGTPGSAAPDRVVFESTVTGAKFLFTPGLPTKALEQAIELDPGSDPGQWMWDSAQRKWRRFESAPR